MIKPSAFILRCPKCGDSKTIRPQSDVIDPTQMVSICPKCKVSMKREDMGGLFKLLERWTRLLGKR